jgi:hypothetical protein
MVRHEGVPWDGAERLDDAVLVHRTVNSERYIKNGLRHQVFLRYPKDTDGLSVTNAAVCTEAELCEVMTKFHECFGVATLRVGDIRAVTDPNLEEVLDVVPDTVLDPDLPCDHAYVTGLPMILKQDQGYDEKRVTQSKVMAEAIATKLRSLVIDIWSAPKLR